VTEAGRPTDIARGDSMIVVNLGTPYPGSPSIPCQTADARNLGTLYLFDLAAASLGAVRCWTSRRHAAGNRSAWCAVRPRFTGDEPARCDRARGATANAACSRASGAAVRASHGLAVGVRHSHQ
jgi:hypothetical protein